jgi:type IV secretion system protein VirB10
MTNNSISSAAPDDLHGEQHAPDLTRLPIEPKGGIKPKVVIAGIVAFVLFLALVFVLIMFAKAKVQAFNDDRAASQAEKHAKDAQSPTARKGIAFGDLTAKPDAHKAGGDISTNAVAATPAPVPLAAKQGAPVAPVRPSMMDEPETRNGGGNGGSNSGSPQTYQPPRPPAVPEELLALLKKNAAGGGANAADATAAANQQVAQNSAPALPPARNLQELAERNKNKGLTNTKQVSAVSIGDAGLVITRGHHLPCVLESQIMSNLPGSVNCILTENIFSTNGKVLLLEKGTVAVGEYKTGLKTGDSRLAIVWDRLETPSGVIIDVDSPSADMVGASGVDGWVDNHWLERVGAAFLLSFVQDAIAYKTTQATPPGTVVVPTATNTTATGSSMTEKILDSTINIAPTMVKNRGDLINIEVRHDLWFQDVYTVQ